MSGRDVQHVIQDERLALAMEELDAIPNTRNRNITIRTWMARPCDIVPFMVCDYQAEARFFDATTGGYCDTRVISDYMYDPVEAVHRLKEGLAAIKGGPVRRKGDDS